ncbi:MAG: carbamoyltransferase HypF, partial [Rubrobacteridae bacterium]|nr:carbamoyltransferase HypF [Rubrobacteridae bacterium]
MTGIVQGVGFRPFVHNLASELKLTGWVINTSAGVTIHIEGDKSNMNDFAARLKNNPPILASIDSFETRNANCEGFSSFFIHESRASGDTNVSIPPDVGTCPDCLREFSAVEDRRFGYEFTNCVNCGPRFSITKATPYDRKNTSMSVFEMCEKCSSEYGDPANRRFHAEPNACPVCGPKLRIVRSKEREAWVASRETDNSTKAVRLLLREGKILAIKGIGGFHLACDAQSVGAIHELRTRKQRQGKPFALMCRDLEVVREHCELSVEGEKIITSPARPILLLKRKSDVLSDEIAPGLDTLGIMLPYTPLHYGLFDNELSVLVMTSANISGDPLILTEEDAFRELGDLADYSVTHNREIVNRAADSVVVCHKGEPYFIRRSRGYVPRNVRLTS